MTSARGGNHQPGWPTANDLSARSLFLEESTAGGLDRERILKTLHDQYQILSAAQSYERIVLWFDACLFDQSMLAHILTCLSYIGILNVELICAHSFPGIEPFHGLGQLQTKQLGSLYDNRSTVTDAQFRFASVVDRAFATQDAKLFSDLSEMTTPPLPWVPAAVRRWLQEQPDSVTGLGRLESLALAAARAGCETPDDIFRFVAANENPPQFWGDTTLWAKINGLAIRKPPLIRIEGPTNRLPQWESQFSLKEFKIIALSKKPLKPIADNVV